jgi:hypothetical protein
MLEPQRVLLVLAQRIFIPSLQHRKNISYLWTSMLYTLRSNGFDF